VDLCTSLLSRTSVGVADRIVMIVRCPSCSCRLLLPGRGLVGSVLGVRCPSCSCLLLPSRRRWWCCCPVFRCPSCSCRLLLPGRGLVGSVLGLRCPSCSCPALLSADRVIGSVLGVQMPQLLMSGAPFVNFLWSWSLPRVTASKGFPVGRIRCPSCSSSIRSSLCIYAY